MEPHFDKVVVVVAVLFLMLLLLFLMLLLLVVVVGVAVVTAVVVGAEFEKPYFRPIVGPFCPNFSKNKTLYQRFHG